MLMLSKKKKILYGYNYKERVILLTPFASRGNDQNSPLSVWGQIEKKRKKKICLPRHRASKELQVQAKVWGEGSTK